MSLLKVMDLLDKVLLGVEGQSVNVLVASVVLLGLFECVSGNTCAEQAAVDGRCWKDAELIARL